MTDSDTPELYETVGPHDKTTAMPSPIVDKIRKYGDPATDAEGVPESGAWADHTLPEMDLPGFGGERYDDCGDDLPHACASCGSTVGVGRTCATSTCSRCAATWCRERATDWAARLMQLKGLRYAVTGDDQFYHHLTLSPPDMWAVGDDEDARQGGREIARRVMSELGLEGVCLYHPYRGDDEDAPDEQRHPDELYNRDRDEDDARDQDDDRGAWKQRLFEGRDWEGDVRDELKFDPHYHIVGVGGFVRGGQLTRAVEDATGWVIHRITPPDPSATYSIRDDDALARVLAYCYSHAGLRETDAGNHRVESLHTGDFLTSASFEVSDETRADAEARVRSEAWRVLGIPSASMSCHRDHLLPPQDDDESTAYGAADDDGAPTASRDGAEHYATCGGRLVAIDEFDEGAGRLYWEERLASDEWRDGARFDAEVARALAEWRREQRPDTPLFDVLTAG